MKSVWLDVDAVLADFVLSAKVLFQSRGHHTDLLKPATNWDFSLEFDPAVGRAEFDSVIEANADRFWRYMVTTPEASRLVNACLENFDQVNIATCVTSARARAARTMWLTETFGPVFGKVRFVESFKGKAKFAKEFDYLIDDSRDACNAWRDAGGRSLLWRTPLNSGWWKTEHCELANEMTIQTIEKGVL